MDRPRRMEREPRGRGRGRGRMVGPPRRPMVDDPLIDHVLLLDYEYDMEYRRRMMERDIAYERDIFRRSLEFDYAYDDYELDLRRRERMLEYDSWDRAYREEMIEEDRRERVHAEAERALAEAERARAREERPPFPDEMGQLQNRREEVVGVPGMWGMQNEGRGPVPGAGPPHAMARNEVMELARREFQSDAARAATSQEPESDLTQEEVMIYRLQKGTCIPLCYFGPHFDRRFSEFKVEVSPVTYADISKPAFGGIQSTASSLRIILGTREPGGPLNNSSLKLMAKSTTVRNLLRGITMMNFNSDSVSVSVEQRVAENENEGDDEVLFFPNVIHKASFKMNSRAIRDQVNRPAQANDSADAKQSALHLHNLPRSVGWTFLRILFPLGLNGQVVEGDARSAFVEFKNPKMAVLHLASITGMQIDDQLVHMKTDVPPNEAVEMLKTMEEAVATSRTSEPPKKKKKLSPSDIRRNLKKRQEYMDRFQGSALPGAPPFPGVPSLMSMSFPGPGNASAAKHNPRAGASAFSGRPGQGAGSVNKARYNWSKKDASATGDDIVPIPQMLEGPYPSASEYYAPGTPSAPGTSNKVRTEGYYRRRGARVAVHQMHLWGGNLENTGKALERSRKQQPALMAPPGMLTKAVLTDAQLQKLRKKVEERVSLEDMRKAEDHWQRKRKEREAQGLSIVPEDSGDLISEEGLTKGPFRVERDRKRLQEFNKKVAAKIAAESQGTAASGTDWKSQEESPAQAGFSNRQQAASKPATQGRFFQPPPSKPFENQQKQQYNQPNQQKQQYNQPNQQKQQYNQPETAELMPPPPPPIFSKPAQPPRNQFSRPPHPGPIQPPSSQQGYGGPPRPPQSPSPRAQRPPQSPSPRVQRPPQSPSPRGARPNQNQYWNTTPPSPRHAQPFQGHYSQGPSSGNDDHFSNPPQSNQRQQWSSSAPAGCQQHEEESQTPYGWHIQDQPQQQAWGRESGSGGQSYAQQQYGSLWR